MLIEFTLKGIYCPIGGFFIDPTSKVDYALITHAHSDHLKKGSTKYLAHKYTASLIKLRVGKDANVQSIEYGQELTINGVKISFHPSGHVIGSAQIRLEYKGEVWVISGDYKIENDGISGEFEHIKCTHFVTESTFARPEFEWLPQEKIVEDINSWWRGNSEKGVTSLVSAYSLGKSQRLIYNLNKSIGKIVVHDSIKETNDILIDAGIKLDRTFSFNEVDKEDLKNALVITPSFKSLQLLEDKLEGYVTAQASGWMHYPWFRPKSIDRAFVISDHADFKSLIKAVKKSGAENIYTMHGYSAFFAKYLNSIGYNAYAVKISKADQLALM